jgi:CP family cyanate transporter-like MFS transporter
VKPVPRSRLLSLLALLWLAGTGLRLTILAIPPVIPMIRLDLGMSETEIGILSGLPPVLLGLAAVPGSLLIARLGAVPTLAIGLLVSAAFAGLRAVSPDALILFLMTIGTGLGISFMQVALPPVVREWLPQCIQFATAVYANGLLMGETIPVALMLPVIMPLTGGSWRLSLALWSLPVALIGAAVAFAPRGADKNEAGARTARRWWPDWRDGRIWRLGFMLGSLNASYFSTNAFLPDFLHILHREDLISPALIAINFGQVPASFLLLGIAHRLDRRAWPYVVVAIATMTGVACIASGIPLLLVSGAALAGFAIAAALVLILALPPLLSAPEDVPRTTAGMFTISYSCAVVVPIISGLGWDLLHIPAIAFLPIFLCGFLLIGFAATFDFRGRKNWYQPSP